MILFLKSRIRRVGSSGGKLFVLSCLLATSCSCPSVVSKQQSESARVDQEVFSGTDAGQKRSSIRVAPIGFAIGRDWVAIEASFCGPRGPCERFATALAGAVRAEPLQWVEIIDPSGRTIKYRRVNPLARIQFTDPSKTAAYEVSGHSVRFKYSLGPLTKGQPAEGAYTYRLLADAPYRELADDYLLGNIGIEVDSHQYQSYVQRRLIPSTKGAPKPES